MRKNFVFALFGVIIIFGLIIFLKMEVLVKEQPKTTPTVKEAKKILMIIAFRDFRDEEYFLPKEIFEKEGFIVKTASTKKGTALGADGGEVEVDFSLDEVDVSQFDAILFVGGPGALKYLDNEKSYQIAKETLNQGKILGAICIAPVILAKAKVLEGKKATVWSSPLDKTGIKILKENGAEYLAQDVVQDGKIITANGPQSAKKFAEKILKNLK